jgi:hypothetical protein
MARLMNNGDRHDDLHAGLPVVQGNDTFGYTTVREELIADWRGSGTGRGQE